ncbi:MAG: class I SAM-dependent methyltransferase [Proteobacteria bacterium]|nr:class I SAM-dependent methyltransferase [Pseudomonadota bacterium]
MTQWFFRAPGEALSLADLLERLAPDALAAARSALGDGRLTVAGRTVRDERAPVSAGAAVRFSGADGEEPEARADTWVALVPDFPWPSVALDAVASATLRLRVTARRGAVSQVRVEAPDLTGDAVLATCAALGAPVLGDVRRGGVLVKGGLRLLPSEPAASLAWPDEIALRGDDSDPPVLRVSAATARALARGHPWVVRDAETGDTGALLSGSLVRLEAPRHGPAGLARIEAGGRVAARLWTPPTERPRSVEARVHDALSRRKRLLGSNATDALRLVHGEADGLPGLAIDRLGSLVRVLRSGRVADRIWRRAVDAVLGETGGSLGSEPVVVQVAAWPRPQPGRFESVVLESGDPATLRGWDGQRFRVRENGLEFWVDPGLGDPFRPRPGVGLFLDQRENRARLRRAARGRWLNLFAHTGAFSAALLAGGAEHVTSVDLSAAYLRWLAANLERNGVAADAHQSVRQDGRRFLEALQPGERFDGIVLDPPTAAAAGRRYWSVRRDLAPLVERALSQLAPGGRLLVARNDRGGARGFERLVRAAATRSGVSLKRVQPAPPGADFPRLSGFPEGDAFAALDVVRA